VNLFRLSALTGNPHRIHYDRPYAMEVEGYPGLVVHGPFTQTVLIDFVRDHNPGRTIRTFDMRARAPLFDTAPYDLVGRPTEGGSACEVWALTPAGTIAMQARATLG
jgi:3-methylfumaryl-CoA hydratase